MDDLPRLWIITPTASEPFLDNGFHATPDEENWGKGIYFLGDNTRTAIIVVHQLLEDPETLWLRHKARGGTQKRAITELEALPPDNPLRQKAVDLLLNLKTTLELKEPKEEEDEDFIMSLSPIYLQKLEEVRQEGRQEERQESLYKFVEKLLRFRFGTLDNELNQIIQPLAALGEDEFIPLIQQLSRSELLDRFN
jgi:hypothetical protein